MSQQQSRTTHNSNGISNGTSNGIFNGTSNGISNGMSNGNGTSDHQISAPGNQESSPVTVYAAGVIESMGGDGRIHTVRLVNRLVNENGLELENDIVPIPTTMATNLTRAERARQFLGVIMTFTVGPDERAEVTAVEVDGSYGVQDYEPEDSVTGDRVLSGATMKEVNRDRDIIVELVNARVVVTIPREIAATYHGPSEVDNSLILTLIKRNNTVVKVEAVHRDRGNWIQGVQA